jgi:2-polyprenyl-6-hydroxyphenyl methylase/3-demethylubiquinone-9 3-methyltransferase
MDNFTKMTGWWDPNSPMNMLYEYNYHRIAFLKNSLKKHHMIEKPPKPFLNLKVLDVGCGAGILSESMTRLGASVLAIDPNPTSIREALNHQKGDDTVSSI